MLGTAKPTVSNPLSTNQSCWWMLAGVVDYKLCDRNLDCDHCPFDVIMRGGEGSGESQTETLAPRSSLECVGFEQKDDLFYHPSHVWVHVEDRGNVRIGLDDFAQTVLGRIYAVSLPHEGIKLEKGAHRWTVTHKAGETPLIIPLAGIVVEVNWKLTQFPSLLNRDPYGSGWAFIIRPTDLRIGLGDLFYGSRAIAWHRAEMEQLYQRAGKLLRTTSVAGTPAMPDGGVFKKDFLSELSVDQMQELIDQFLPGPKVGHQTAHRHEEISKSKRR